MARVTIEDYLTKVPNRFELVILTMKRTKRLLKGTNPLLQSDNQEVILALREIVAGKVRKTSKELKPR